MLGIGISSVFSPNLAQADRAPVSRNNAHVQPVRDDHRGQANVERHEVDGRSGRDVHVNHEDRRSDERRFDDRRWDGDRDIQVVIPVPVYQPDFDQREPLGDVPRPVLDAAYQNDRGLNIESVDYVRRDGSTFYEFRLERPRLTDLSLRIGVDGAFLGLY